MRDPTLNTGAAADYYFRGICFERTKQWPAKAKRAQDAIKEAAIDEACYHLARIALDIVSLTDRGANTHDPKQGRRHTIAAIKIAAETRPQCRPVARAQQSNRRDEEADLSEIPVSGGSQPRHQRQSQRQRMRQLNNLTST